MPRIELTISTDYVPDWSLSAGLRELVQNTLDGADAAGTAPVFEYDAAKGRVLLRNTGLALDRRALLLGHTTKLGVEGQRGAFGEGLKLGVLALLRTGRTVEIASGGEVWTPKLGRSQQFAGAEVLIFETRKRKHRDEVEVRVSGVTPEEWLELRTRVLALDPPADAVSDEARYVGTVLFEPHRKGHLYVKGLFVEHLPELEYGYDLLRVDVDRDRKMVARSAALYEIARLWDRIVGEEAPGASRLRNAFYQLLHGNALDTSRIGDTLWAGTKACDRIAEKFRDTNGADVVVAALGEEAAHSADQGLVTIPINAQFDAVFKHTTAAVKVRRIADVLVERKESVKHVFAPRDLTESERFVLERCTAILRAAIPEASAVDITAAELDTSVLGLARGSAVLLNRIILTDVARALETLVHELAHVVTIPGPLGHSPEFHANVEHLFGRVLAYFLARG